MRSISSEFGYSLDVSISAEFLNSGDISRADESRPVPASRNFMPSEAGHNSEVWRERSAFSFQDSLGFRVSADFNVTKHLNEHAAREIAEIMSRTGFILSVVLLLVVGVAFWIHSMVLEKRVHSFFGSRRMSSDDEASVSQGAGMN
jgi:hypothetical protein